ncbi:MAG: sulfurtransferase TusA family protein [Candidatus Helarchaeota archaeon]|nr:sulfurtransferase TusA family protein [Candidatus Helarchaeota archaeon]
MSKNDFNVNLIIDSQGQTCPYPLIEVKKAMKKLSSGEILKLITTDPICPDNVDSWCEVTGNTLVRVDNHGDKIDIYVKKA